MNALVTSIHDLRWGQVLAGSTLSTGDPLSVRWTCLGSNTGRSEVGKLLEKAPERAKELGQGRRRAREMKSKGNKAKGQCWYKNMMNINWPQIGIVQECEE